jgi:hypothetical protein
MTSPEWLAGYLEQGVRIPGLDAPHAATDDAQRLRILLASPDLWSEPPGGLLDQISASIARERAGRPGPPSPRCWPPPRSSSASWSPADP